MAWNYRMKTPVAKAGATVAINGITAANCQFADSVGAADPNFAAQLAAAQAAAVAALAAMTGNAPNVEILLMGRSDTNTGPSLPSATGGQVTITIIERWP